MARIHIKTPARPKNTTRRFHALDEAREAIDKLRTLKQFLSPQDQETLALLMDKELMHQLQKSLQEARQGKVEPLHSIL